MGCSTVPHSTQASTGNTNAPAHWHTVFVPAKTNHPPIHWYNKVNPVWWVGNVDEPIAPSWYEPGNKLRTVKWHFRNPLHNFNYYVIGVADKDTYRSGKHPKSLGNPNGGVNFAVTRWKLIYLPFIDIKIGSLEMYFGWREKGNPGGAFRISGKKEPKEKPPPAQSPAP